MNMTRMSQKSRDDLVSMLYVERNALRCEIMFDAETNRLKKEIIML